MLHPWWGISPGVLDWRDALVAAGARVGLPDLYGGTVVETILEAEAMSNAVDDVAAFELAMPVPISSMPPDAHGARSAGQ